MVDTSTGEALALSGGARSALTLRSFWPSHGPKVIKGSIGVALLSVVGWSAAKHTLLDVSGHAVIGANVTLLRSPIGGRFDRNELELGTIVPAGAEVGRVDDRWADDQQIRELQSRLDSLDAELASLTPFITELQQVRGMLRNGTEAYRRRQVARLRLVLAETQAAEAARSARANQAEHEADRAQRMADSGLVSTDAREQAESAALVARSELDAASQAVSRTSEELQSAHAGVNVGGFGFDLPYSTQKADDVTLELARWQRYVDEKKRLRTALSERFEQASRQHERLTHAVVDAPRRARLWQTQAQSGAFVSSGAPLLSLVDCDRVFAVAAVSQRVFDGLRLGRNARFEFRETSEVLRGEVVQLVGATLAGANPYTAGTLTAPGLLGANGLTLELAPDERYLVVVALEDRPTKARHECTMGQSGEVRFD